MSYRYLALGNSLTLHGCCDYWWNNIGMAASAGDRDYVSLVAAFLEKTYGGVLTERYNYADWERAEDRGAFLPLLDPMLAGRPDLITVQLGENVSADRLDGLEADYCQLLRYLRTHAPQALVLVIGDFWSLERDRIRATAAKVSGCPFVNIDLARTNPMDRSRMGAKVYDADGSEHIVEHPGVAAHPGDSGMATIANCVIRTLKREGLRTSFTGEALERYQTMLDYVAHQLAEPVNRNPGKTAIRYSRYDHIRRVLNWALRIYDALPDRSGVDLDLLVVAAIFHDVGYNTCGDFRQHAAKSAEMAKAWLTDFGMDPARVETVCAVIAQHSQKSRMKTEELRPELLILMEADLLDDMGAQGIVMDCWIEGLDNPDASFASHMAHIDEYTLRQMQGGNPMRTEPAKRFWAEKTKLTEEFYASLYRDLEDRIPERE